jgi:uncharacterized protein
MTAFEIDLRELEGKAIERSFRPSRQQLEELFEGVDSGFSVADHEDFAAHLRAQLTDSTVHVAGRVEGEFAYECGRCLTQRSLQVDTEVDFVLMSEQEWSNAYVGEDEIALREEEMDVSYYEGDIVDLASLIREAVLLEFPAFPQCPEASREECDRLFEERVGEQTLEELEDQKVDLRLSPLKKLKVTDSGKIERIDDED